MTHHRPDGSGLDPESPAAPPNPPHRTSTADFKDRFGGGPAAAGLHEAVTMRMAPMSPAELAAPISRAPEKKKGSPVVGFLVLAALVAVPIIAFTSCGSDHEASGPAATTPTTVDRAAVESTVRSNRDAMDLIYIQTLDKEGIPYTSKDGAISLAHVICDDMDSGTTAMDVANKMMAANSTLAAPHKLTLDQLGEMMGAATQAYCPAHVPELGH